MWVTENEIAWAIKENCPMSHYVWKWIYILLHRCICLWKRLVPAALCAFPLYLSPLKPLTWAPDWGTLNIQSLISAKTIQGERARVVWRGSAGVKWIKFKFTSGSEEHNDSAPPTDKPSDDGPSNAGCLLQVRKTAFVSKRQERARTRLRHNRKKKNHSPQTHDLKLDVWPSLYGGMSPHSLTHARVHW